MRIATFVLGAWASCCLNTAFACSYDGQMNNPFVQGYPGSLRVALSTQHAFEKKQLAPLQTFAGQEGLARATAWLEQLRKRLENTELQHNFSLYLLDSQLWTRFDVVAGNVLMQSHIVPSSDEIILISTETTLAALLNGQIDISQAQQLGLIRWVNKTNTKVQESFANASRTLAF